MPAPLPVLPTPLTALLMTALVTALLSACGEPRAAAAWQRDLPVCQVVGQTLRGDLLQPPPGVTRRRSALFFIHGGGWSAGTRADYAPLVEALAAQGFTGLTIDYRLSPQVRHPQHLEDVQCAWRWLQQQAPRLGVDAARIAVIGGSAGAHLAALLAFRNSGQAPAAAVLHGGPHDLTVLKDLTSDARGAVHALLGSAQPSLAQLREASPVQQVRALPVLILHGAQDPLVPADQARRLHAALQRVNAEVRLRVIPGAGHGDFGAEPDAIMRELLDFLSTHL
jgi:acetyl esterase/lipase